MIKNKYTIILIGFGNIGNRYLESLILINKNLDIHIIEKKKISSIKIQKNIDNLNYIKRFKKNIFFYQSIPNTINKADLGIISTGADSRKRVFLDLISKIKIKKFIFEKVLFQNINDYKLIYNFFINNKINAWVNCNYRSHLIFKNLKKKIKNNQNIFIEHSGFKWGMGCNSIHFIDLFCYLFDSSDYDIDTNNLINRKFNSKRKGYIEFFGKIIVTNKLGHKMILIDKSKYLNKSKLTVRSKKYSFEYCFSSKSYIEKKMNNINKKKYEIPLLSKSIYIQINKILTTNNCDLPNILDSINIHTPMIKSFLLHVNNLDNKKYYKVKIT